MYDTLQAPFGGTFVATKAGLTGISGAATTYSTGAAAQEYCINGKAYSKAQVSGGTTPTTDKITGAAFKGLVAGKKSVFVFTLNAAGTVGVAQGSVEAIDTPQFPTLPDTEAPFAYVIVTAGSTTVGTWTFGIE